MAKTSKTAREHISRHVKKHRKEGMDQRQAVAAAYSEARRKGMKAPKKGRGKKRSTKKAGGKKAGSKKSSKKGGAKKSRSKS